MDMPGQEINCPARAEYDPLCGEKGMYCFGKAYFEGKYGKPELCDPENCQFEKIKKNRQRPGEVPVREMPVSGL
jgi:hypothetical protein